MKTGCVSLAFWFSVCAAGVPCAAAAADSGGSAPTVYCYDRSRDVVSRELTSTCHGEVVDDAFARTIEERRAGEIARQLRAEHQQSPQGLRLARIGTAFFIDTQARLLTASHVVAECKKVTIVGGDRLEIDANVLALDQTADLAVLGAATNPASVASFGPLTTRVDDRAVVIVGFPDQGLPPLEPVLTRGTLLRAADDPSTGGNIVFHADVRAGDSGGPMFDSRGSVIGIVKAKADTVRIFRETGRDIEGIGLATGLPTVLSFLRSNAVSHQETSGGRVLDNNELLATTSKFVVRAQCWN